MPELNTITDPNLPEPKGVSTATADQIYVANGSGSGVHQKIYTAGWEDYNDAGISQPLTSGVYVDLTNDGSGLFTNTSYRLPGFNDIWDTTNNQFDWSAAGLSLGDTVDIRIDVNVITVGANHEIALALDMAHGSAGEYQLKFYDNIFKTSGTYTNEIILAKVYMGDANTLNNPAKVSMFSDSAGNSVVVNGWYIRVIPRNPIFSVT